MLKKKTVAAPDSGAIAWGRAEAPDHAEQFEMAQRAAVENMGRLVPQEIGGNIDVEDKPLRRGGIGQGSAG